MFCEKYAFICTTWPCLILAAIFIFALVRFVNHLIAKEDKLPTRREVLLTNLQFLFQKGIEVVSIIRESEYQFSVYLRNPKDGQAVPFRIYRDKIKFFIDPEHSALLPTVPDCNIEFCDNYLDEKAYGPMDWDDLVYSGIKHLNIHCTKTQFEKYNAGLKFQ